MRNENVVSKFQRVQYFIYNYAVIYKKVSNDSKKYEKNGKIRQLFFSLGIDSFKRTMFWMY